MALRKLIVGSPFELRARHWQLLLYPSPSARYDRQTVAIMKRCLSRDSNCIDVGAHRGAILQEILRVAPQGRHFAIEPLEEHAKFLARSFPTTRVYSLAASNAKSHAMLFHMVERPTRSSLFPVSQPGKTETRRVPTDLLDNLIPAGVPIRFIKIDVEGAELLVLQGSLEILRRDRPIVVFEHDTVTADGPGLSTEIYQLLVLEIGMQIFRPRTWLEDGDPFSEEGFFSSAKRERGGLYIASDDPRAKA